MQPDARRQPVTLQESAHRLAQLLRRIDRIQQIGKDHHHLIGGGLGLDRLVALPDRLAGLEIAVEHAHHLLRRLALAPAGEAADIHKQHGALLAVQRKRRWIGHGLREQGASQQPLRIHPQARRRLAQRIQINLHIHIRQPQVEAHKQDRQGDKDMAVIHQETGQCGIFRVAAGLENPVAHQ